MNIIGHDYWPEIIERLVPELAGEISIHDNSLMEKIDATTGLWEWERQDER